MMILMMIKMIVGQLKLVVVPKGEPFAGAFGNKTVRPSNIPHTRKVEDPWF